MTCPPDSQDLSVVYAVVMLLIGIILGMNLKQPKDPSDG